MAHKSTLELLENQLSCEEYTISGLAAQLDRGYSTVHRWVTIGKKKLGSRGKVILTADIGKDGGYVIRKEWVLEFYRTLREDIAA